jgi:hypothetical protein
MTDKKWQLFRFSKHHNWKIDTDDNGDKNWFIDCGNTEKSGYIGKLIITAVNACKEINHENPQAVAESIVKMRDMIKELRTILDDILMHEKEISRGRLGRGSASSNEALYLLNKISERN